MHVASVTTPGPAVQQLRDNLRAGKEAADIWSRNESCVGLRLRTRLAHDDIRQLHEHGHIVGEREGRGVVAQLLGFGWRVT
jgi:hypothetical protein